MYFHSYRNPGLVIDILKGKLWNVQLFNYKVSLKRIVFWYNIVILIFNDIFSKDLRRLNTMAVKATNSGIIIIGGGVIKHHICNANMMVSISLLFFLYSSFMYFHILIVFKQIKNVIKVLNNLIYCIIMKLWSIIFDYLIYSPSINLCNDLFREMVLIMLFIWILHLNMMAVILELDLMKLCLGEKLKQVLHLLK